MSSRKKQTKRIQCIYAGTRMLCLHYVWSSFHWNQGTHSHLLFSKGHSVLEERVGICQDILEVESVSLSFSPLPHPLPDRGMFSLVTGLIHFHKLNPRPPGHSRKHMKEVSRREKLMARCSVC